MSKKEFALIGYPLGHSKSPEIHTALLKAANIDGDYTCRELKPESLQSTKWLSELDGYNVTIPHKTNIIPMLDELSEKASLFGAVNTVKNENGKSVGYNTDCTGFLRALETADIKLGGRVLVLGSGGVSRMFAFESVLAGAELTIAARNAASALDIKREIKEKTGHDCRIITLSTVGEGYDLIINGTPVGMYPNTEECPVSKAAVQSAKAVFDAIYNPKKTLLLKYAEEAGIPALNGMSMLVWQAAAAEEIWNGIEFNSTDVENVIKGIRI